MVPQDADGPVDGQADIESALEKLRLKLLDLTGRNRLLNFKHTAGRSLQLCPLDLDRTFQRLVTTAGARLTLSPVPEPSRNDWVEKAGRLAKPDAKEFAARQGLRIELEEPSPKGNETRDCTSCQTLYYTEDLGKHCRKLDREARLAIEETGSNMFYLVFGFLEFPDVPDSDRLFQSPLICLPARMEQIQDGTKTIFKLAFTGDEVDENLSLREKLKRDHSFILPSFPEEEEGIERYFREIERAIFDKPRWRVRRAMNLALLSFANMLLIGELEPDRWVDADGNNRLTDHEVVMRVFEGQEHGPSVDGETQYADEYDIDSSPSYDFPIIFDADSSQHSALIDVMKGYTMVIEGPPGTGKSQTITNIIAACLHAGKSVLFVAEKLAALQVVKGRLEQAGLESFVLELHSNKTSKKLVLESINERLKKRAPPNRNVEADEARLSEQKAALREHADLLESHIGNNLGCSVHDILWRAERARCKLGPSAETFKPVAIEGAPTFSMRDYQSRTDQVRYLANHYDEVGSYNADHPLWGFYPNILAPGDDLAISNAVAEGLSLASRLEQLTDQLVVDFHFKQDETLGSVKISETAQQADQLVKSLPSITSLDVLVRIFSRDRSHSDVAIQAIEDGQKKLKQIDDLRERTTGKLLLEQVPKCRILDADEAFARQLKIDGLTASALALLAHKLAQATAEATYSVAELDRLSSIEGLSAANSISGNDQFHACIAAVRTAPTALFLLRHDGLVASDASGVLSRAISQRTSLLDTEKDLASRLYLDDLPDEREVRAAILTLREGARWFRIFQKPWRRAIALHRKLQRRKQRIPSAARLEELEALTRLTREKAAWLEDRSLRTIAGQAFHGFDTPLDQLQDLVAWINCTKKSLELASAHSVGLRPETVSVSTVEKLRAADEGFSTHKRALAKFSAGIATFLPGTIPDFDDGGSALWTVKLEALARTTKRIAELANQAALVAAPEVPLGTIFETLKCARTLLICEQELASSKVLADALGDRHSRFRDELDEINRAIAFGLVVRKSTFPAELKQQLCSERACTLVPVLKRLVSEIERLWHELQKQLHTLRQFGEVHKAEWMPHCKPDASEASLTKVKFERAQSGVDGLIAWSQYLQGRKACIELNLSAFVEALESQSVSSKLLPYAFTYRFHASIAESLFRQHQVLKRFRATHHNNVRSDFRALDKALIAVRGRQIAARCIKTAAPPSGNNGMRVEQKTEMHLIDLLRYQVRPRVTVRSMMKRAGRAIQALKPCFMMGPQAVAQFLDPGALMFDVVIMDEASQMRPEAAIGAIARGKQLIVVGDPKQLPPTSFFSRSQAPEDEQQHFAAVDAESILDVASMHFTPVRSLRWHYRSRHESLIAFSNQKFYDGKLHVFPSPYPRSKALGVRSHFVADAVYENQMNQREAARVVDFIVEHVTSNPGLSLGVVTLNVRQRDLISELLQERFRAVPAADRVLEKWSKEGQGLFVKNLENVQGDERDSIIISTTFGRPPGASRPHQYFGPISQEGGWRRLNVLFTRARSSVLVVTSLRDTDIVVDIRTPRGTRALRDYLLFASTGVLRHESGTETGLSPESDFEIAVIAALQMEGYTCVPQVGVGTFRIDIGVRHPVYPHLFLAGIECDGAAYHSGVTVRDRDRIRQEILECLGWKGKLWRIWSTEWFRGPRAELKKLLVFLAGLAAQQLDPTIVLEDIGTAQDEPGEIVSEDLSAVSEQAMTLVLDSNDLEVEVGDHVTYIDLDVDPAREISVAISNSTHDLTQGIISSQSPFAQALIGGMVDETVVLRIPRNPDRHFKIQSIQRRS